MIKYLVCDFVSSDILYKQEKHKSCNINKSNLINDTLIITRHVEYNKLFLIINLTRYGKHHKNL